jgi:hypothetical protein
MVVKKPNPDARETQKSVPPQKKSVPPPATGTKSVPPKPELEAMDGGDDSPKASKGSANEAERVLSGEDPGAITALGSQLIEGSEKGATASARVLSEVIVRKPEAVVPLVDRFVTGIRSDNKRVVQTSAEALPVIAKIAPARVAKHLEKLKSAFDVTSEVGKDGLVRTFAALCAASVAYQKRLEPVLKKALGEADGKTLIAWTQGVLPALKGEPHANARAVVEERLATLPKATAQPIADFLGIKLRVRPG